MTDYTARDIDAIRQREQAATEGPWVTGERRCTGEVDDWEIPVHMDGSKVDLAVVGYQTGGFQFPHADAKADAKFIAHARTDVPALLAKVDELTAELAEARARVSELLAFIGASESLSRAAELTEELALARRDRDEYAAVYNRVAAQLAAANRRNDGLQADLNSATKANTAWANETAAKDAVIEAAKTWRRAVAETGDYEISDSDVLIAAIDALPKPSEVAR